ncbi:MAG: UDP-N-acetylglucosamine 4,6-dehydratase (inverting) [Candidatus Kapaibacterium sp.]
MSFLKNKSILITGGTGSFGKKFVKRIITKHDPARVIIYSRDEYKQYIMQEELKEHSFILRFFIGDVRDKERLYRAFEGVDTVIHAAALKHVPLMEYNPIEAVRTNISGAENVINASIDKGVEKVIALSTDKAVNPVNLYGATKLVSDKLFISANAYSGRKKTSFSVVRYGNVAGSRGSVTPFFMSLKNKGQKTLPVTDERMTRFWISLDEAVNLVLKVIKIAKGGEIFVSKIPSFRITDLVKAIDTKAIPEYKGIRPGEKLHEVMITEEDSQNAFEYEDEYIIYPRFDWWSIDKRFHEGGKPVEPGFRYSSDTNKDWLSVEDLRNLLNKIDIIY